MKPLNDGFQNCKLVQNRLNRYREIAMNMTQNEHVSEICCRPEIAGDVISGENVKTIESYALLIVKLLALRVSEKIRISHLRNA